MTGIRAPRYARHGARFAVVCAFLALVVTASAADELPGPVRADILDVVDGDTLRVVAHIWLGQQVETLVRLRGIDAPELHGRCPSETSMANEARTVLARLVGGSPVTITHVAGDKYYGRVLADVASAQGKSLAPAMLESGLVRPYDGTARAPWCEDVVGSIPNTAKTRH